MQKNFWQIVINFDSNGLLQILGLVPRIFFTFYWREISLEIGPNLLLLFL